MMTGTGTIWSWPLCIFYGMFNAASVNSYVLYCHNKIKKSEKTLPRYQFMLHLSHELARPWMQHRQSITNLQRGLSQIINDIMKVNPILDNTTPKEGKRTTCFYCPSRLKRMTTTYCHKCSHPICGEHSVKLCTTFAQDM